MTLRHVRIARADDPGHPRHRPAHHNASACMAAALMQTSDRQPFAPVYLDFCRWPAMADQAPTRRIELEGRSGSQVALLRYLRRLVLSLLATTCPYAEGLKSLSTLALKHCS